MMPTVPPPAVSVPDPSPDLLQRAAAVRRAAMDLGRLSDGERRQAVLAMADALQAEAELIAAANAADWRPPPPMAWPRPWWRA
jgi:glutamate-5-semialdehyde dehydrogenase